MEDVSETKSSSRNDLVDDILKYVSEKGIGSTFIKHEECVGSHWEYRFSFKTEKELLIEENWVEVPNALPIVPSRLNYVLIKRDKNWVHAWANNEPVEERLNAAEARLYGLNE